MFNDTLAILLCGVELVCLLVSVGGWILCSFICGFGLLLYFVVRFLVGVEYPLCLFACEFVAVWGGCSCCYVCGFGLLLLC